MQTVILPRFNSDESFSEEDSQTFMTPPSSSTSNQNTPSITSNDKSLPSSTNDNSLYKHIINTPHTNVPSDRSRHPSNNQTTSLPPLIDRTTKTTYKLRQQPKLDYRTFYYTFPTVTWSFSLLAYSNIVTLVE